MRRLNQIAAIVLVVAAVLLGRHAVGLQFYTPIGPGPGFFPLVLCVLLGALAAIHLLQVSFASSVPLSDQFPGTKQTYLRMTGVLAAIGALTALMPFAGFRLSMLAFYVAVFLLCGRRRPFEILMLSIVGSFGMHYVLSHYLSTPLPQGLLGI
jgi:hypothetical protein